MEPVSEQVLIPMVEPSGSKTGISPPQGVIPGPGIGVSGTPAHANPPITSGTIEISGGIVNATGYNGMGAGEGKVGETVTISGGSSPL